MMSVPGASRARTALLCPACREEMLIVSHPGRRDLRPPLPGLLAQRETDVGGPGPLRQDRGGVARASMSLRIAGSELLLHWSRYGEPGAAHADSPVCGGRASFSTAFFSRAKARTSN